MSDLRYMSREFLGQFIKLYKQQECLWKIKSPLYLDRNLKREGYKKLAEKMQEVEKNADIEFVKKKINSLRTTYRTELRKIRESKTTGSGADKVYTPTLWYFSLLDFLRDQEIPRKGTSSRGELVTGGCTNNSPTNLDEVFEESSSSSQIRHEALNTGRTEDTSSTALLTATSSRSKKRPRAEDILAKVDRKLDAFEEDSHDIFGRNIAAKLKKLDGKMRIFAEKLINDVIFEAELGTLNRAAHIVVNQELPSNNTATKAQVGSLITIDSIQDMINLGATTSATSQVSVTNDTDVRDYFCEFSGT